MSASPASNTADTGSSGGRPRRYRKFDYRAAAAGLPTGAVFGYVFERVFRAADHSWYALVHEYAAPDGEGYLGEICFVSGTNPRNQRLLLELEQALDGRRGAEVRGAVAWAVFSEAWREERAWAEINNLLHDSPFSVKHPERLAAAAGTRTGGGGKEKEEEKEGEGSQLPRHYPVLVRAEVGGRRIALRSAATNYGEETAPSGAGTPSADADGEAYNADDLDTRSPNWAEAPHEEALAEYLSGRENPVLHSRFKPTIIIREDGGRVVDVTHRGRGAAYCQLREQGFSPEEAARLASQYWELLADPHTP